MSAWLLPESIADVLPSEARRIEELRRSLLDRFRVYGYELVMPPMLEYVESLLTGTAHGLDLKTFKLVDQASGRTLGLRADITPQVARIDAHLLNRRGVTRLCYCGTVLHTRAQGMNTTREPLQIGAELYGHTGVEADLEVVRLAVDSLAMTGIKNVRIDLGHAGILPALLEGVAVNDEWVEQVHTALSAKDAPRVSQLLSACAGMPAKVSAAVYTLLGLYGTAADVLARARAALPQGSQTDAALAQLEAVSQALGHSHPDVTVLIDLSDLRGYEYHSGLMFSGYAKGAANALVRGGRYDNVGTVFGRARPATGFSGDVREWVALMEPRTLPTKAIRAPWNDDLRLAQAVRDLRDRGEIVVQALPGSVHEEEEFECDRALVQGPEGWTVAPLR